MSKIKIRVTLKNDKDNLVQETTGTYQNSCLKYEEDKNEMKVTFNYKENIIKRENNEFSMTIDFNNNLLSTEFLNYKQDLIINTTKIEKNKKNVEIEYEIDNGNSINKFLYRIEEIK